MDHAHSTRPANASRPARRSLAEFALPPAGVSAEAPVVAPPMPAAQPAAAPPPDRRPPAATAGGTHDGVCEPMGEDQKAAVSGTGPASASDDTPLEDSAFFAQFEDMTTAAAKAAKDYRALMLDYMQINMTAALNCAHSLAGMNSAAARPSAAEPHEAPHLHGAGAATPAAAQAADEYRAKAFSLMSANINSTLEFAQRLAHAKTPTEVFELSTRHAREHFALMVGQTTEIGSMARRMATPGMESAAGRFMKLLGERRD